MNNYSSVRIGILGASGYAGSELVGLLARHPRATIVLATSESAAGTSLRNVNRYAPDLPLVRVEDAPFGDCDVVFSCLPHGASAEWTQQAYRSGSAVIDLSHDLRVPHARPEWAADAVYGLPELHRERVRTARLVANPGCYPTAALLALAPLLRRGLVVGPVVINAASGATGAGRSPRRDLLFAEVADDFRAYAVGNTHRHLEEMRDQTALLAGERAPELVFAPHLLPVRRGILETILIPLREAVETPERLWLDDYADEPLVDVFIDRVPSLADVVGTSRVAIGVRAVQGVSAPMLMVVAAIDNLLKGAAGQAVQNLNLMCGWPETEGLP